MATGAKAQEPSMEEILASIRRIIADDTSADSDAKQEAETVSAADAGPMGQDDIDALLAGMGGDPEPEPAEEEVLDLTEQVKLEKEPEFKSVSAEEDIVFAEPEPAPPPPPRPAPAPPPIDMGSWAPAREEPAEPLISNQAGAMVGSAFNQLAHTVLVQNARTLDDLVKDMLKPMLKQWLDDNLPQIVDRLVRSEIERVSRGRG